MKVIGISGFARCGKDTFVSIAKDILEKNGYKAIRVAFADALKDEVQSMLDVNKFSVDVRTTDTILKNKIRPLMVWWGCARRDLSSDGLYWVNIIDQYLNAIAEKEYASGQDINKVVILVSDVRFTNEADWIHNAWNGQVIHIKRWSYKTCRDGYGEDVSVKSFDIAPNEEEAKNDPLVQNISDVKIEWESRGIPAGGDVTKDDYLKGVVNDALNSTSFFKHTTIGILSI